MDSWAERANGWSTTALPPDDASPRARGGSSRLRASLASLRTIPGRWGAGLGRALRKSPILYLLVIGLAIRLLLAPFTSWTQDVYPFYRVAVDTLGGLDPYATSVYTYPPLLAYLLFPLNLLLGLLTGPASFATLVPSIAFAAETTE